MFLLQLQLYVLTIIRVTLRRIQKSFRRKSTFCKFKHIILSKGYKESQFYKLYTMIVANEPYTDHLYWQESTWFLFTSVYFDGDLTFFKNLPSNSLPKGKSFQSNATKFPHPGLHIAMKYPKAEPKKGTMKISRNKSLQSLFIKVATSPKIHVPVTAAIIHFNCNPCYTA